MEAQAENPPEELWSVHDHNYSLSFHQSDELEPQTPRWLAWLVHVNWAKKQAEGLALLDAELVTLVEVNPVSHIQRLATLLADKYLAFWQPPSKF